MGKNIVICLDGTGNQARAKGDTNVVRLFSMLDLTDPGKQVGYYDPGVGTFSDAAAWSPLGKKLSRLLGLAFGTGLRANLAEAYLFLMRHWEPGDRIYLFGFSRGAYAARALAGLLATVGILRPGSENLVPYAIAVYTRSKAYERQDWRFLYEFANLFSREVDSRQAVPIAFVGLWDSVKAAGILRWELKWPFTRKLRTVERVRHAVSIHEKRRPYGEYLVTPANSRQRVEQVWFGGVHSDVGGTFEDDPRLSTIALAWVTEGAREAGVLLTPGELERQCALTPEHAFGTVHRMGWVWALLTYRRRQVPAGASVHQSVRDRLARDRRFAPGLPGDVVWVDWTRQLSRDYPAPDGSASPASGRNTRNEAPP
jgi:uncharacterized protein (DUF2235 family)